MILLRYTRNAIVGLVAIAALAALAVFILSEHALRSAPEPQKSRLARATAVQRSDAPRQLRVMGCIGCHGETLQGALFLDLPGIAKLYAPNLTLVSATVSDVQLDRAIRQGIGHDGRPLLVMPSEGFQFLSDSETAALISAIREMPRGGEQQPSNSIGPRGRIGLALGKFRPAPALVADYRKSPIPDLGPQFAQGRHIVEVNCSECHGADLKGKEVEPGTVSSDLAIVGAYDSEQFRRLLRDGVAPGGKKLGLMGAVARRDFSHMTNEEIANAHSYLAERARRMP